MARAWRHGCPFTPHMPAAITSAAARRGTCRSAPARAICPAADLPAASVWHVPGHQLADLSARSAAKGLSGSIGFSARRARPSKLPACPRACGLHPCALRPGLPLDRRLVARLALAASARPCGRSPAACAAASPRSRAALRTQRRARPASPDLAARCGRRDPARSGRARRARGFGRPGEGVEHLHLGRLRVRPRAASSAAGGQRPIPLRGSALTGGVGSTTGIRRDRLGGLALTFGALALVAAIAQAGHQVGELVQRHAGDRQHVRRRLEPGAAVLGAQNVGQPFQHVDADRAGAGRVIARQRVVALRHVGQVRDRDQPRRRRFRGIPAALRPATTAPAAAASARASAAAAGRP